VFTSQCICSLWHLIFGPFRNLVNTIQPAFDSIPAWHYEKQDGLVTMTEC